MDILTELEAHKADLEEMLRILESPDRFTSVWYRSTKVDKQKLLALFEAYVKADIGWIEKEITEYITPTKAPKT